MDKSILARSVVRIIACFLLICSVQKAWAGLWLYNGEAAFKQNDFAKAFSLLKEAEGWDAANPTMIYLLGRSAWHAGRKTGKKEWFETASILFEKMTHQMPYYGRGWLYRALTALELERNTEDGITSRDLSRISPFFEKAIQRERGSGWVALMTGIGLLSHHHLLTDHDKASALDQIKRSVAIHYPNQASPYLDAAFSFLWEQFQDLKPIEEITPMEYPAYERLVLFLEWNNLWEYWERIYRKERELILTGYRADCERGEELLEKGNSRQAFEFFQKAYWKDKLHPRARMGMLIARQRIGRMPPDYEKELQGILEGEEGAHEKHFNDLRALIRQTQNPYLAGLYSYQKKDFLNALKLLAPLPKNGIYPFRRRTLAASAWQLGQKEKALEILQPVLEEKDPDLQELSLLAEWNSPYQEPALQKMNQVALLHYGKERWWGDGRDGMLSKRGRLYLGLNLKPGRFTMEISMRSLPQRKKGGYAVVRLENDLIGTAFVNHFDKRVSRFEAVSLGGLRRLSIELLNGSVNMDDREGPVLVAGDVKITYQL